MRQRDNFFVGDYAGYPMVECAYCAPNIFGMYPGDKAESVALALNETGGRENCPTCRKAIAEREGNAS